MTTITSTLLELGDAVLDAVGRTQAGITSTAATVSTTIAGALPAVPRIPIPAEVPTSREVIERSASFATKVLEQQKAFALDLVEAFEPLWGHVLTHDAPKTRKAAVKTAA